MIPFVIHKRIYFLAAGAGVALEGVVVAVVLAADAAAGAVVV